MTDQLVQALASAEEVCADIELSDEARTLLRPSSDWRTFADALIAAELGVDATRVVARALPKAAAVEWAIQCVKPVLGEASEEDQACMNAAEQWLADPSEENRQASLLAAEAAGYNSPAAWVAAAAAWTGGSLTPPGVTVVPPGDHLTALAAAGAIGLAAAVNSETTVSAQKAFLQQGYKLFETRPVMPDAPPEAAEHSGGDGSATRETAHATPPAAPAKPSPQHPPAVAKPATKSQPTKSPPHRPKPAPARKPDGGDVWRTEPL